MIYKTYCMTEWKVPSPKINPITWLLLQSQPIFFFFSRIMLYSTPSLNLYAMNLECTSEYFVCQQYVLFILSISLNLLFYLFNYFRRSTLYFNAIVLIWKCWGWGPGCRCNSEEWRERVRYLSKISHGLTRTITLLIIVKAQGIEI